MYFAYFESCVCVCVCVCVCEIKSSYLKDFLKSYHETTLNLNGIEMLTNLRLYTNTHVINIFAQHLLFYFGFSKIL